MVEICYNYRSTNRIKQPWDVEASPRPLHQKGKFLMNPNDTTRPAFIALHPNAKNLTGQRFGRLVALGPVGRNSSRKLLWLMQCDCGNTSTVAKNDVAHGETLSCGCYIRELTAQRSRTHGMSRTPLYKDWVGIVGRCTKPKNKYYMRYGSRGITICDEWRYSFEAFCAYVLRLPCYGEKGYSLDRIDNDGNYEPGNVRWATRTEQMRNTRANHMVTYSGKTQCVQAWEEELGFRKGTLSKRLQMGWTVERAMTQTVRKCNGVGGYWECSSLPHDEEQVTA